MKKVLCVLIFYSLIWSAIAQGQSHHKLTPRGMQEFDYRGENLLWGSVIDSEKKYKSYDVSFNAGSIKQYALISLPESKQPEKGYPVIFLLHGYIPPSHYSTFKSYSGIFRRYARSEFAVIKPDFRGHGRSEAGDFDPVLSKLYYTEDLCYLVEAVKKDSRFDSKRLFIMGHSNGGDIALRFLAGSPGDIKAASLWGPVTVKLEESNFFWRGQGKHKYGDRALELPESEALRKDFKAQAVVSLAREGISSIEEIRYYPFLKEMKTPLIIRHADSDESVPYSWSIEFKAFYEASGNPLSLKFINYPGDNHNLAASQAKAQAEDLNWFRSFP